MNLSRKEEFTFPGLSKFLVLMFVIYFNEQSFSQTFIAPDTACINQTIMITGYDTTDYYHDWYYEATTINNSAPKDTTIMSFTIPGGASSGPVFMSSAYSRGNYYSFVNEHMNPPAVWRQNWGNSLINYNPTNTEIIDLSVNGIQNIEGISVVNEVVGKDTSWYAFICEGLGQGAGVIIQLSFGDSITSTPTLTNSWLLTDKNFPTDIHVVKDSNNWYAFVSNEWPADENNTQGEISVIDFGPSLANPTSTIMYYNFPITVLPPQTGIYPIKEKDSWYIFCVDDDTSKNNLYRINLNSGNPMTGNPTVTNLGNPNGAINGPRVITLISDCNSLTGIITNTGNNSIAVLDFNGSVMGPVTATQYGNLNLNYPHSISNIYREGGITFAFVVNITTGNLVRLEFNSSSVSHTNPTEPVNNQIVPASYSYDSAGTYNIALTRNYDISTTYCKNITIIPKPIPVIVSGPLCAGSFISTTPILANTNYQCIFPDKTIHDQVEPRVTGAGIYSLVVNDDQCYSDTVSQLMSMIPSPVIIDTMPASVCDSGQLTLGATANKGTIYWYATATDTSKIDSGSSYKTPKITVSTTYYVDASDSTCTSAPRTAITASVIPFPIITDSTPASVCDSGKVILGATPSAGTVNWYASETDTVRLDTGKIFSPRITITTTFYVTAINSGCTSLSRTAVIATVKPSPAITDTTPASVCDSGQVILGAIPDAGSVNWYASETDTARLHTGETFTSFITITTTYYVTATNLECTSVTRTPVTATVYEGEKAGIANAPAVICDYEPVYNLFQSLTGYSNGGIWENINHTGLLSGNNFYSDSAKAGNYSFQYKINSIGACPADSVLISVSVLDSVKSGTPLKTPYDICSVDSFNLFNALTGNDAGGLWKVDSSANYSIAGNLKDSIFAPQFLKGGLYKFTYYFVKTLCSNSSTTITILTDTTAPKIKCINDTVISHIGGATDIQVGSNEFDPISVSDNCGKYLLTYKINNSSNINDSSTLNGATIPLTGGVAEITWTVKDYGNNESVCATIISIQNKIDNMFTPNGDGHNDTWELTLNDNVKNPKIEIYDRWGVKVYSSSTKNISWDGGNCPNGTYRYIVLDGNEFVLNGFITLIR